MRTLPLAALSLVAVVLLAAPASACDWADRSDRADLRAADASFLGVVERVDVDEQLVTWTFDVEAVFKGDVVPDQQVLTSLDSSCSLGIPDQGTRYLVFAHTEPSFGDPTPGPGQLLGAIYEGTRPAREGARPAGFPTPTTFGEPSSTTAPRPLVADPPGSGDDDIWWLLATAGALALVVVLAIAIPRDRQRGIIDG